MFNRKQAIDDGLLYSTLQTLYLPSSHLFPFQCTQGYGSNFLQNGLANAKQYINSVEIHPCNWMGCTVLVHSGPNKKGFIGSLPVRGRNYPNEQSVVVIWSHILITFDQVCCFFTVNCENSFFFPNFMAQCLFFLANNFVMQPTKVATIYSWRKRYSQNLAIYTRYEFFFVFKGILLYS